MPHTSTKQSGFTLIEILTVMTLMGVLLFIVMGVFADFIQANQRTIGLAAQTSDVRSALASIEREVSFSKGVLKNTGIVDASKPGGWSWDGADAPNTTNRVLIVSSYATSGNDTARNLLFSRASDCKLPLEINTIYYVKDRSLLRRRLVPTDMAPGRCGAEPSQRLSCPASAITATSPCTTPDAVVVNNVESFTVDYFAAAVDAIPLATQYDTVPPPDISAVKTIKVRLTLRPTAPNSEPYSGELRMGLK